MTKAERITEQVRALSALGLAELRKDWTRRYGEPPKTRSADLVRRLLAWRIQVDAFGGLDAATIKLLTAARPADLKPAAKPGMRLAREWNGRRYEVLVEDEGVLFNGELYGSLSEVARIITGTRWNGLRFFGLREKNVR